MNWSNNIEINPEIRFGEPIIIGTRISVSDVLNWMANGMNEAEIILEFPELTSEAIRSCLKYASEKERKTRIAS